MTDQKRQKEGKDVTPWVALHRSQQDQVVGWSNTGLSGGLPGLPPSTAHIGHLQDLMLGETDLIGIFRVGLIRIDRLRTVRIFRGLGDFIWCAIVGQIRSGRVAEAGLRGAAVFGAGGSSGITRHGRRGLEAVELSGRVHLRGLAGCRLGSIAECS